MLILTRLKAVSWFVAIITILVVLISVWAREQEKQSLAQHDIVEQMLSTAYKRSLVRAEYFVSRDDRPKEQYLQLTDTLTKLVKQAMEITASPNQALILQEIVTTQNKTRSLFTHFYENWHEMATGSISAAFGQEIERRVYTQLIIDSQALLTQLLKLQKLSEQEYRASQTLSNTLILISVLILSGFTAASLMMVARSIAAPLKRLKDGIEVISTGNLEYRIDVIGNDELSALARDSNEMAIKLKALYTSVSNMQMEIDERKRAEDKLKQATEELQRSNKELEQFAYVASHDLQEPLRMVSSYTQLLAQRYENQLDDKANLFIHYAVDGAVRMQGLINDLLTYSRIGAKGKPLEPVDVNALLGEVINNLKVIIAEAKAVITNENLPEVRADASQLVQLFQNLISNGVKFRGAGYPHIHIAAEDKGTEWLFSVRDNGIGIDPQFADKIFVIFQRLHTKEEYPGSGMGLAICKKIVERHGGRIWFESKPGKGSTFYFSIQK